MLKQATGRRELVRAITVTVALLPILIVSGAGYGAGFTPAPKPMPAPSLEMQSSHHDPWFTLKDENPQQVGESRTRSGYFRDRSVPIAEPIPIVAIAGQAQPARTTAITSTVKPAPAPAPSNPPRFPPTRLLIPAIDLNAPVVAVDRVSLEVDGQSVTTWAVPDSFAVGWHNTSAMPGRIGNTLINGHSNIHGEVFRDLEALELGDEIVIYAGDAVYRYQVTERHLLQEENISLEDRSRNTRWMMPTKDERLTLLTCAPYPRNTHRLVVVALPVEAESVAVSPQSDHIVP